MVKIIENALIEVFRFDGWQIGLKYNTAKSESMNGQYYDITNFGGVIATFNLSEMQDAYRTEGVSEEFVAKEIVGALVASIEKAR